MIKEFSGEMAKLQSRTNCAGRINVSGMQKVEGQICKETYPVTKEKYQSLIAMIQDDIKSNYSDEKSRNIIKTVRQSKNKLFKEYDKNWLIFVNDNGSLSYYGFLMKRKEEKMLVGIYEFKLKFTLQKDIYIKNKTSYSESSSFFGGSQSQYVSIDYEERKSRGLCKEDVEMLCQYADLMEMEFKEISF